MKIAINIGFGGFCLSKKALVTMDSLGCEKAKEILYEYEKELSEVNNSDDDFQFVKEDRSFYDFNDDRTNQYLIKAIESLGKESFGYMSHLRIVEIPDDVDWYIQYYDGLESIQYYDGLESIHEKHGVWY